jgi:hypothetical protein
MNVEYFVDKIEEKESPRGYKDVIYADHSLNYAYSMPLLTLRGKCIPCCASV